ncbi:hypothetical protein JD844_016783 [Phrynosoma platyrhinos]|uniref:Protein kinase domain-containing protein n=1 Tax=Phrynosoma platyrhinos TaxID=52577 RepID=A0ABQ7SKU0_PHRPL|nr:hypothetical protein JD844_016783 [Phrynosoma platyrhinos]
MTTSSKKTSSSSVVNSLAKIFDPNALQNQHHTYEEEPSPACPLPREDTSCPENMSGLDVKISSLDQKINTLLTVQDNVLQKLDCVSQDICSMGESIELLKEKGKNSGVGVSTVTSEKLDVSILCIEINKKLSDMSKNAEQQSKRLDGLEQVVLGIQQLVGSLVEKLKTSTITDLMRRNESPRKLLRVGGYLRKDKSGNLFRTQTFSDKKEYLFSKSNEKEKSYLTAKGTKPMIKKKKPPDSSEESDDTGKVHKLNKENTEKASPFFVQRVSSKFLSHELKEKAEESHWTSPLQKTTEKWQAEADAKETSNKHTKGDTVGLGKRNEEYEENSDGLGKDVEGTDASRDARTEALETIPQNEATSEDVDDPSKSQDQDVEHKDHGKASFPLKDEHTISSKHHVIDKKIANDVKKKSRVDVGKISDGHKPKEATKPSKVAPSVSDKKGGSNSEAKKKKEHQETSIENICIIDDSPPPPAPFDHRIVSAKRTGINSFYHVHKGEVLGGGRFGQVHKCEEKSTGLTLAAKIIKARGVKEKDEVKNEINVMNQLNHVNLIQLYDAFESKNDIILVMEYVEGGELFDRIIDENYNLSEMDTILYKPREKLKVNFGTPEFLAPEVVNYDFVSFPTDMWSVGIIAYMLLSGLSPFLGDDDNETLNNILACRWDFDDEEFAKVSEEAKDFISKLLIKEKGWRISATAALKHPWLSDQKLHSKLLTQKKAKGCSTSQALETP